MLLRLLLLFTIVPLTELALLFWIAEQISWQFTIGLVLATGILGAWLARLEGWRTLRRIQQELAEGKIPGDAVVEGLLILVAGTVLITPGVITDLLGFALLIPPCRRFFKDRLKRRFAHRFVVKRHDGIGGGWHDATYHDPESPGEIIDARVIEDHPDD